MEGPAFVKWIERNLIENDISKDTFYAESGISTATMSQWRSGDYKPSARSVKKAEDFFANQKIKNPTVSGEVLDVDIDSWLDRRSDAELLDIVAKVTRIMQERK